MSHRNVFVKVVLFTSIHNKLSIFFLNNSLPSVRLIGVSESDTVAYQLVKDCLRENIPHTYLEQLYTFSNGENGGIDIVYYALIPSYAVKSTDSFWIPVEKMAINGSDWKIIQYALQRLRWKVEYTNVVYSLLPQEFTLSELQILYEAILGKILDKRNFRKKILSLGILQLSNQIKKGLHARPAKMYQFKEKKMVMVKVF